jgi:hypothetical protein
MHDAIQQAAAEGQALGNVRVDPEAQIKTVVTEPPAMSAAAQIAYHEAELAKAKGAILRETLGKAHLGLGQGSSLGAQHLLVPHTMHASEFQASQSQFPATSQFPLPQQQSPQQSPQQMQQQQMQLPPLPQQQLFQQQPPLLIQPWNPTSQPQYAIPQQFLQQWPQHHYHHTQKGGGGRNSAAQGRGVNGKRGGGASDRGGRGRGPKVPKGQRKELEAPTFDKLSPGGKLDPHNLFQTKDTDMDPGNSSGDKKTEPLATPASGAVQK